MNERPPGAVFTDPEMSVTEPKGDVRGMALHESAEQLRRLAASVSMTPEQFRERFGYLVGLKPELVAS